MLPSQILWGTLPDPDPPPRPQHRLRDLLAVLTGKTQPPPPTQELVNQRVRRGAVQALVREAYQATIAEQDAAHRGPAAFTRAWRERLTTLLTQPTLDLPGWDNIGMADLDTAFAWKLFDTASQGRHQAIDHARASPSRPVNRGQKAPTFQFEITADGATLGEIIYGTCPLCRAGLLYKISFTPDWHYCGFGGLALRQLETRHPDLTWYTTGQLAPGFFDSYRQDSASPWTNRQHPCPHFR